MKISYVLPHELEDPVALKDFVQAIEGLGYDGINLPDHVIGANPATYGIMGPYTHKSYFNEPVATLAFFAALTTKIELATNIVILPQRQTVLFAKQAAAIDVLSGGRLRVGVGVGWNPVEYGALNMNFKDRGKRVDEQVALLRRLWSEELVTFEGEFHKIVDAGINPRPIRQPLPIWFGGWSDAMIKRIARIGDGWLLPMPPEEGKGLMDKLNAACDEVGRDRSEVGIQPWIVVNKSNPQMGTKQAPDAHEMRSPDEWAAEARAWKELGATHMDCWSAYGGLRKADEHIAIAERFKEVIDAV